MFGLQFTLEYDPSKLEVQGDGMELLGGYQSFGGVTVDKEKGILTYPVINSESTTELVETEQVGYVTFKALQEGSTMLTLTNIKAVNTNSKEIQYNTQTQKLLNISKTPTGSDSGQDPKPIESQDSEPSNSGGNNTSTDNPDTTAPGSSSDQNSDNSVGNQSDNNDSLSSDVDNNADVPGDNEDSNTGNLDSESSTDSEKEQLGQEPTQPDGSDNNPESSGMNTKALLIGIAILVLVGLGIYILMNQQQLRDVLSKIKTRIHKDKGA